MRRILMKKFVAFFCVGLSLMSLSCVSIAGTIWDDSVPPEQRAKIAFGFFEPTSYNQMSVNKKDFRIVSIPSGNAAFSGNIKWSAPGRWVGRQRVMNYFSVEDAVFSCKLEGGKEYWAIVAYKEERGKLIWGIELYNDVIKNRIGFPPQETLIGFIPFNPPVFSPPMLK